MHILVNMAPPQAPATRQPGPWTCHRVILLFTLSLIMLLGFVVLGAGTSMLSIYRQSDTRRCVYMAEVVMISDTKRQLLHELVSAWQCDLTSAQLPVILRGQPGHDPPLCEGDLLSRLHRGVMGTIATGVALAVAAVCGYAGAFVNRSGALAIYMVVTLVLILLELGAVGILVYNKSELDRIQPHADRLLSQPAAELLVTSSGGLLTAAGPLPTPQLPQGRHSGNAVDGESGRFAPPTTRPPLRGFSPPRDTHTPTPQPRISVDDILIELENRRSGDSSGEGEVENLAPRTMSNATEGVGRQTTNTSKGLVGDGVAYNLDSATAMQGIDFVPLESVSPTITYQNISNDQQSDHLKNPVVIPDRKYVFKNEPAENAELAQYQSLNHTGSIMATPTSDENAASYEADNTKAIHEADTSKRGNESSQMAPIAAEDRAPSTADATEEVADEVLPKEHILNAVKASTVHEENHENPAGFSPVRNITSLTGASAVQQKGTPPPLADHEGQHPREYRPLTTTSTIIHHDQQSGGAKSSTEPSQQRTSDFADEQRPVHGFHDVPPPFLGDPEPAETDAENADKPDTQTPGPPRPVHRFHDVPPPFLGDPEHAETDAGNASKPATQTPGSPPAYKELDAGPRSAFANFSNVIYELEDGSSASVQRRRRREIAAEEAESVVEHWAAPSIRCSPSDAIPLDVPCFGQLEDNLQTELDRTELLMELLLTPLVCAFLACILQMATLCATWHLIKDCHRAGGRRSAAAQNQRRPDTAV